MKEKIFKSSSFEIKTADEKNRTITAIASKEVEDRDGDIVRVGDTPKQGINITEYKKNPVVLFAHNSHDLPIAKSTRIWKDNKQLMVKMQFPEPEVSSVGDTIYKLIKGDYLKSLSIGFRPKWDEAVRIDKSGGWDFKSSDLMEISIVPVGANPSAKVTTKSFEPAIEDGIIDKVELDELDLYLKDLVEEEIKDVEEPEAKKETEEIKDEEPDVEKETEKEAEAEKDTNIENKTEQNNDKEFDPYAYIFDVLDEPEEKAEDEDKDLQKLYDALGL